MAIHLRELNYNNAQHNERPPLSCSVCEVGELGNTGLNVKEGLFERGEGQISGVPLWIGGIVSVLVGAWK